MSKDKQKSNKRQQTNQSTTANAAPFSAVNRENKPDNTTHLNPAVKPDPQVHICHDTSCHANSLAKGCSSPPLIPPTPPLNRTDKIEIRVNAGERKALEERFGKEKLSTVLRDYLLTCKLPRRSRKPDPKTLRALAYVGNNLNQIAKKLNTLNGKAFDKIKILRVLAELRKKIGGLK